MTTTTTKLTTDNKQKATSKTACDARGQQLFWLWLIFDLFLISDRSKMAEAKKVVIIKKSIFSWPSTTRRNF